MKKHIVKIVSVCMFSILALWIIFSMSPQVSGDEMPYTEPTVEVTILETTEATTAPTEIIITPETQPAITEPEPEIISTKPAATEPSVPVTKPPKPTVEETKPRVEETEPVPPETEPVVEETTHITEPTVPETEPAPTIPPVQSEDKYPAARQIWNYMKYTLGWNDYVCAGVMGNLMVETGGGTLNLNPCIYNSTKRFYGMCQWSLKYYPNAAGMSIEQQCNLLKTTIEQEFKTFGRLYKAGFTYSDFTNLQNAQNAALAFAKVYERCAQTSSNYTKRQNCAIIAYNYFVG